MRVFDSHGVLMIKMSRQEALQTIQSLANQLVSKNCNAGRLETFLEEDGRDFSIAVAHTDDADFWRKEIEREPMNEVEASWFRLDNEMPSRYAKGEPLCED